MIIFDTRNTSTPILTDTYKFIASFMKNNSTISNKFIFSEILDVPRVNPGVIRNEIKKTKNIETLRDILNLEYNWNDNRAQPFSIALVEKAESIIKELTIQPEVFPTARNSIQFEYELTNGDYLEIEIWHDKIEVFIDYSNGVQYDYPIPFNPTLINNMVLGFHGQDKGLAQRNII